MRSERIFSVWGAWAAGVWMMAAPLAMAANTLGVPVRSDLAASASTELFETDGSLSWRKLAHIEKIERTPEAGSQPNSTASLYARLFAQPVFADDVMALAGKRVKVRGYALVRWQENGTHALMISSMPPSDADGCPSGGMETQVVASFKEAVTVPIGQIVTVEGVFFHREAGQRIGVYYRLFDAKVMASS